MRWAAAGYPVVLGSRARQSLTTTTYTFATPVRPEN